MTDSKKTIYLANPRGFCAGVKRAILTVDWALQKLGTPLYVHHEVVHNRFVIAQLQKKGAIFIEDIKAVPERCALVFSAHGVSLFVECQAQRKNLQILDATCPLVKKVHSEVRRLRKAGFKIIMIGHTNHPEVIGTMGQSVNGGIDLVQSLKDIENLSPKRSEKLAYVTQTTLSVEDTQILIQALKRKFPGIVEPSRSDICYATQNRQDAVMKLARYCDGVVVVGSANSSNSTRLKEIVIQAGKKAWMVDEVGHIQSSWFNEINAIGLTAGASAPEDLITAILHEIQGFFSAQIVEISGVQEKVTFALPAFLS